MSTILDNLINTHWPSLSAVPSHADDPLSRPDPSQSNQSCPLPECRRRAPAKYERYPIARSPQICAKGSKKHKRIRMLQIKKHSTTISIDKIKKKKEHIVDKKCLP